MSIRTQQLLSAILTDYYLSIFLKNFDGVTVSDIHLHSFCLTVLLVPPPPLQAFQALHDPLDSPHQVLILTVFFFFFFKFVYDTGRRAQPPSDQSANEATCVCQT